MTNEEFQIECVNMQKALEAPVPEDAVGAIESMRESIQYIARIAYLLSHAKNQVRMEVKKSGVIRTITNTSRQFFLSSKAQNTLVDNLATEEILISEWLEQMNYAFKLKIEVARTIVSFEKVNMQNSSFQGL